MNKRIFIFTKYSRKGASSRLRTFQYLPFISTEININLHSLFSDDYLDNLYNNRKISKIYIANCYIKRFFQLFLLRKGDVVWIEKELFPYLPSFFEIILNLFGIKYIVDYDDAIFHNYDSSENLLFKFFLKNKIKSVMKYSNCVMVGNHYLEEYAVNSKSKNVSLLPTVVNHNDYLKSIEITPAHDLVFGWIGTPKTQKYILELADVFERLSERHKFSLLLIGASLEALSYFDKCNVDVIAWSEETEVESISKIDVGLMPLPDEPWERGKCGYKLIQYMACGKAVIGSNVGVNKDIIMGSNVGLCVDDVSQWDSALEEIIKNPFSLKQYKINALSSVKNKYSISSQIEKLSSIIDEQFNN